MYGTSKTLTTKLTSYHLIYDIPKADTLERTLPLPMDLTLKVLQLKHTKYMIKKKSHHSMNIQYSNIRSINNVQNKVILIHCAATRQKASGNM